MSIGNVNNYTYDYDTYGRLNKIATPAGDLVVSEVLRTFVSERLQMPNASWRSRRNRPT